MSIPLPSTNLNSPFIGQTGNIDLSTIGVSAGAVSANPALIARPATLMVHNESGAGLLMTFSTNGLGSHVPAGAWMPLTLPPGEAKVNWIVEYIIPNPPVTQLFATYYAPGELIPQITLGNSPIGGSTAGTVATNVQNVNNSAGTEFIFSQVLGEGVGVHAVSITNDGVAKFGDALHPGSLTANGPTSLNDGATVTLGLSTDTLTVTAGGANMSPPGTSINGGTSGTATVWMDLTGTIKHALIFLSNFRTAASAQNLVLPTAFTSHAIVRLGVIGVSTNNSGVSFLKSSVAQSMRIFVTPAVLGDAGSSQTVIYGGSWAEIQSGSGFDTVQFQASGTLGFTGIIELVGQ